VYPISITSGNKINLYIKSVENNTSTRYPAIYARFANSIGGNIDASYDAVVTLHNTKGSWSANDITCAITLNKSVSNKYMAIMISPDGNDTWNMKCIISAISIS
jgi:hypothetical protein